MAAVFVSVVLTSSKRKQLTVGYFIDRTPGPHGKKKSQLYR